jgi:adenylate kinase
MATPVERKKLAAEQYLAENRIRWMLEIVTSDLLHVAPTNPYKFICQRVEDINEKNLLTLHRHRVVAVLGGPASGKGAVCAHLAQELGTISLAPSELLRSEIKDGTETGRRVGEMLHASALVPKEIIAELMKKKMDGWTAPIGNQDESEPTYVLDGFPRAMDQAMHFEEKTAEVSKVIYLKSSVATMRERMSEDGDDREKQINDFRLNTLPVVEYFKALGKLVEIDADLPAKDVMALVEEAMRK